MTFLPIVARELRVASRRRSTYWVRTGATLVVILLGTWLFLVVQNDRPRQVSIYLFGTLTGSAIFYSLLTGVLATTDCLSEEKREGTLGLLFLTRLTGYDVVLGKLAANSVKAFYSVVAMIPVMGVPLLMGSLTAGEFGRMALVAVNSLFFSLSLGLCASAANRSAYKAVLTALVLVVVVNILLPGCAAWSGMLGNIGPLETALLLPAAGFSHYLAWDKQYCTQGHLFWCSLGLQHGIAWSCLVLASTLAPLTWQNKPMADWAQHWREQWQLWAFGGLRERNAFRGRVLSRNAFFWLGARRRLKPVMVWAFLGLVAFLWAWGSARQRRDWLNDAVYIITALTLNLVFKVWFAVEATGRLAEERKAGALELLLTTPLSVREILYGQRLSLMRQFLGPLLFVLAIEAFFMFAMVPEPPAPDRGFWVLLWSASMVMLTADLIAIYWVGMWQGLTAKNLGRAIISSLARIVVFPWITCALGMLVLILAYLWQSSEFEMAPAFYVVFWFISGLLADLWFACFARHKLLTEFRAAAQQKYAPPEPIWARWRERVFAFQIAPEAADSAVAHFPTKD